MKNKKKKLWILIIVALVLVAAITAACIWIPRMNQKPVYVYGFEDGMAGMADFFDGGNESAGLVTTDRIQPVYLTDTQTITEILVTEGQHVSKGDVLCTYDTTLSMLALQKKELSLQQAKLDLETAKRELAIINSYVPISYRPVTPVTPVEPEGPETSLSQYELEGLEYLAYAGQGTTSLTPKYCWLRSTAMLDEAMMTALFEENTEDALFVVFQHTQDDANDGQITDEFGVKLMRLTVPGGTDAEENPQEDTVTFRIGFYDPGKQSTPSAPVDDGIDWNSGYTAEQIAQMRTEKKEQIKQLEYDIRMGQSEYKIMCKEADDGKVIAQFDGTVVGLIDEQTARQEGLPLMKVSDSGGFYVTGSISELDLPSIQVGQTVEVMSWYTGTTYQGTITQIQQFPQSRQDYYYGTEQDSYYPYTVFISEDAQLQDGFYVSIILHDNGDEGGLYLENAFLRTENSGSYVFVRNDAGVLEKRYVRTGQVLWGNYTQILDGLTREDMVAFPYGKQVREGAPTQPGDWQTLYGY